jgi:hypothetical protein
VNYEVEQTVDISGIFWIEDQENNLYMRVDASQYRVRDGVSVLPDLGTGALARPQDSSYVLEKLPSPSDNKTLVLMAPHAQGTCSHSSPLIRHFICCTVRSALLCFSLSLIPSSLTIAFFCRSG